MDLAAAFSTVVVAAHIGVEAGLGSVEIAVVGSLVSHVVFLPLVLVERSVMAEVFVEVVGIASLVVVGSAEFVEGHIERLFVSQFDSLGGSGCVGWLGVVESSVSLVVALVGGLVVALVGGLVRRRSAVLATAVRGVLSGLSSGLGNHGGSGSDRNGHWHGLGLFSGRLFSGLGLRLLNLGRGDSSSSFWLRCGGRGRCDGRSNGRSRN